MEVKMKAGRKPIPDTDKKVAVIIYVKSKHKVKAKSDCLKIQTRYDKL